MGALVINHNTTAINTHRNMLNVDQRMKRNLEHLSSGERVVRSADGPATLMISEQMRAQIASVTQAMRNAETSISMVQTTEAALNEVNHQLLSIRQLAVHAANEGANDELMLAADQFEVKNTLEAIDRVAQSAVFGSKKLLDGSRGVNGVAAGKGLTFLRATPATKASPEEGYEVRVTQTASKATRQGSVPLTRTLIDQGVTVTVSEGGRVATYTTKKGDDSEIVVNMLNTMAKNAGVDVTVEKILDPNSEDPDKPSFVLKASHNKVGSEHSFVVASSVAGVLATSDSQPESVNNGLDLLGNINSQLAIGRGNTLTAAAGTQADGLLVTYDGPMPTDPKIPVGRVNVSQNSLIFQIGPNAGQRAAVALEAVSTQTLARNMANESGYRSLADVDVRTAMGAADTMRMVDRAIDDLNRVRADLGAVQKNSLESQLRSLGVAQEELVSAESVIRDADMAEEMSEFTRNQVIMQSSMAMMGHANQSSQSVLSLLRNG
ncbi:MAG: flagellin [Deltaproteobacteria bacterium]|nr:flagellin [Deltaproteobacteria bacterium]